MSGIQRFFFGLFLAGTVVGWLMVVGYITSDGDSEAEVYNTLQVTPGGSVGGVDAVTVYFGRSNNEAFVWTLRAADAATTEAGRTWAGSRRSHFGEFSLDRHWPGSYCIQSANHDTDIRIEALRVERGAREAEFSVSGQCVESPELDNVVSFEGRFIVSGDGFDRLLGHP